MNSVQDYAVQTVYTKALHFLAFKMDRIQVKIEAKYVGYVNANFTLKRLRKKYLFS